MSPFYKINKHKTKAKSRVLIYSLNNFKIVLDRDSDPSYFTLWIQSQLTIHLN